MKKFMIKHFNTGKLSYLFSCLTIMGSCIMSLCGYSQTSVISVALLAIHAVLTAIYEKLDKMDNAKGKEEE